MTRLVFRTISVDTYAAPWTVLCPQAHISQLDLNAAGQKLEDILNSTPLELIYHASDSQTFLHHNGTFSTPDLLCVSSNICISTKREIIEVRTPDKLLPILVLTIQALWFKTITKRNRGTLRRLSGKKFTELLDLKLGEEKLDFDCHPYRLVSKIIRAIIKCTRTCIPRGKVKTYKCFWSPEPVERNKKRDRLRRKLNSLKDQMT
ncbi:uncharacterized protein NPIL_574461 [Nephila pilipes]|uniref:Uncharacterized protein n=1 Tax=Nephila pilipes TaxID=299642 RepID=A0A8X6TH50_NEPPI|nr:uncharacterized protein NPIL_574461 [Nephila pilipes]